MEAILIFSFVALFELVTTRFGADSRDGDDWATHTSV